MTTQEVIALAKEKLGKEITEQEAQDYLSGKTALPDEALAIVSGGGTCGLEHICPKCQGNRFHLMHTSDGGVIGFICYDCYYMARDLNG